MNRNRLYVALVVITMGATGYASNPPDGSSAIKKHIPANVKGLCAKAKPIQGRDPGDMASLMVYRNDAGKAGLYLFTTLRGGQIYFDSMGKQLVTVQSVADVTKADAILGSPQKAYPNVTAFRCPALEEADIK